MSSKSIRKSYSKFLAVLNEAGVKLNDNQKDSLDSFILAIESKMAQQKEAAIKATKKIVTEHLEAEYKKVFESILAHQAENAELAAKIQNKVTSIKESRKIADKVDNYLDLYVESVLPKRKIIDYDRMQKLENLHESLKDLLVMNEDSVQAKKAQLSAAYKKIKGKFETELARTQAKLEESMSKNMKLNKKIDQLKAVELLESKTRELPSFEARQMKKRLADASTVEIEKNFNRILESVKDDMKTEAQAEETSIEEEVKDILEGEMREDDIRKTRPSNMNGDAHNLHDIQLSEKEKDDSDNADCNEEEFETMEHVNFDENGDVQLDESDIIDANLMKMWCAQAERIHKI